MKRISLPIIVFVYICCSAFAQHNPNVNVTFFGSSVCRGSGAEDHHGYGWQFFDNGAIDTIKYKYFNASTGGDNTIKVEKEDRLLKKLYPTDPDIVVIGLSLANEGIMTPQNDNGREQIVEQFRTRLLALADSLNRQGIRPVIVNCYAQSSFNNAHYEFTKKMNRMINTWKYPSINVLGTIDDLEGKWVEGYAADPGHPNTAGHQEMSYAIVPSLFDAILMGKKIPAYDWHKSYLTMVNDKQIEDPLSIDIESTMHSFTLSFRYKETGDGSIAGFVSDNFNHTLTIEGHTIHYKELSVNYPKNQSTWTHVVLSHSYANQKTLLYVNGELVGSVKEQLSPTQVYFGGTAQMTDFKDLALHRSSLNETEALDLFNKKFIQSSLEFYNPLTRSIAGKTLQNYAQSLTVLKIDTRVLVRHNAIEF
jgi:lysophospholipase L1-like esterase